MFEHDDEDENIELEEGLEYQDVALTYISQGMNGIKELYLNNGIAPEVSIAAWNHLYEHHKVSEELAAWLVWAHTPTMIVDVV